MFQDLIDRKPNDFTKEKQKKILRDINKFI